MTKNVTKLKYEGKEIPCGHCKALFVGTPTQAYNSIKQQKNVFCSAICRHAYLRGKFQTPVPEHTCQACGIKFASRRAAKYCSLACYTGSNQFREMLVVGREKSMTPASIARRAEMARRGEGKPCLECGQDVYVKKSEAKKKFCSTICYRAYMAKRFDRQIAAPETLALPQAYDEFLLKDQLPCLVEGCDWVGSHLSLHMNQMHGIVAEELKRAAGFNRSSGIVSRGLSEAMSARALTGVAARSDLRELGAKFRGQSYKLKYASLEGKEHRAKSMLLVRSEPGPTRQCIGCGNEFTQSSPMGRAKYCCKTCRSEHYSKLEKEKRRQHTASIATL